MKARSQKYPNGFIHDQFAWGHSIERQYGNS